MKKYIELENNDMISLRAGFAKSWLINQMYSDKIKEEDSARVRFRYPPLIEMICTHIAYAIETTPTQVFLAGVLYNNSYCGTNITQRLADIHEQAILSDNIYIRKIVSDGTNMPKISTGRRKQFRMKREDIESMGKESKSANLTLTDLGLLRFYCWYLDMAGGDTEIVNVNKFKEFKRTKQAIEDAFEDLNDYVDMIEKTIFYKEEI